MKFLPNILIEEYEKHLHAYKLNSVYKTHKFLEKINKIYLHTNLNSLVCIKEIKFVIKTKLYLPKENSRSRWLHSEFYQTIKKETLPNLCKHFQKMEKRI